MCEYCTQRNENDTLGKEFALQATAGFKSDRYYSSWIMKNKADDKAGIMISTRRNNQKNKRRGSEKMLKIKDDVDLKELEKFGYEADDIGLNEPYLIYRKYISVYTSIDINAVDRVISKNIDDEYKIIQEKDIQDLVQAGLVEKV